MSRAAEFITDSSRDRRCDEMPASVALLQCSRVTTKRQHQ